MRPSRPAERLGMLRRRCEVWEEALDMFGTSHGLRDSPEFIGKPKYLEADFALGAEEADVRIIRLERLVKVCRPAHQLEGIP